MKFKECKIGDIVTPKTDKIKIRDICNDVTYHFASAKTFIIDGISRSIKTVDIIPTDTKITTGYCWVDPSCLSPANSDKFSMSDALHGKVITRPQTSDYKLDFEVRREANELSDYYHGIKLATVRCHPDDAYDEEFGLHLLLRRACLKLKDEHTVVETVEELLQKS